MTMNKMLKAIGIAITITNLYTYDKERVQMTLLLAHKRPINGFFAGEI